MNNFIRNKAADFFGLVPPAELEAATARAENVVASLSDGYSGLHEDFLTKLRENQELRTQLADKDEEIAFLKELLTQQIEQAQGK